jgi:hypothetical protein
MLTSLPRTMQDLVELRLEQDSIWRPMRLHVLSYDRAGRCLRASEYTLIKR